MRLTSTYFVAWSLSRIRYFLGEEASWRSHS